MQRLEIEKDDGAEVGRAVLSPLEAEQGDLYDYMLYLDMNICA